MSALHLTVDVVDNAAAYSARSEETDKKEKADRRASWKRLPWTKGNQLDKPLPRNLPKGGTGYTDAKVAAILRDFLQPDTKLSEKVVAESILALIPTNAVENREVSRFSSICVELAEQIPYDHPSQFKLAQLLRRLAPPDEENPNISVNLKAFAANLYASGLWGASPGFAFMDMRLVFGDPAFKDNEAWWRNAEVMEAAQWILWHGQTVFKFILYDHDNDDADNDDGHGGNPNSAYRKVGAKLQNVVPVVQPRSIERWRYWKDGFAAVTTQPYATEECKQVAGRAARLMEAIEASMRF
ncbi:hypothetical protein SPI_07972 [Niveomyces insectorum RCEF 264]|uniref:Uncharacterized protein n=1 Tax=Niveomyces insectorum RCEF 264 TaxID=1081102 RepID=A0A167P727_9HYPO|nr:hypothetical protein SPI_07972 [Niveomyces insectorum RCEF 264]